MPQKKCPKNLHVNRTEKVMVFYILKRILDNLAYDEDEDAYFIDRKKLEPFQVNRFGVCIGREELPVLQEFAEKIIAVPTD